MPLGWAVLVSALTVVAVFVFREPLLEPMRNTNNPWVLGLVANVAVGLGFLWIGISRNSLTQDPSARRFALVAAALAFMGVATVLFLRDAENAAEWIEVVVGTLNTIVVAGFVYVVLAEKRRQSPR